MEDKASTMDRETTPTQRHHNHTTHTNNKTAGATMDKVEDMEVEVVAEEPITDVDEEAVEAVVVEARTKARPTPM